MPGHDADRPPSDFALDGSVFSPNEALGAFDMTLDSVGNIDTAKILDRNYCHVAGAWWRLLWQQACSEVRSRFSLNRRSLSVPSALSATGVSLQLRLQNLCAPTDHKGAAAVQK